MKYNTQNAKIKSITEKMEEKELLQALAVAERLKDTTRHCYTSKGRQEMLLNIVG